ncbi:hypothetical protein BSKO_10074 [Bryopsis sp. KO-2023]|nr:hypothetical protein BSKO_10074 [Bryopsis sp. KO-2023]
MYAYLSKKIAIPNRIQLRTLSWNAGEDGWIACGGENGLVKVLRLDAPDKGEKSGGGNLSVNQTLDGHNGDVKVIAWNETHRKLTTSDQYGLIIVWAIHKDAWFEEMINNRNKSVVQDMRWTPSGEKICIVYEDGAVIVGGVDGNRLWGKELGIPLALVTWSPDDRMILFTTTDGRCHIYDDNGNFTSKVPLVAVEGVGGTPMIIAVEWYDGHLGFVSQGCPVLAIAFDNGRVQLMAHESDDDAIVIDTGLQLRKVTWNKDGSVLAACGMHTNPSDQSEISLVQFYSPMGKHLHSLRVPGSGVANLSWEGNSLRMALAVDSFIYFANVRPDYQWGYFCNTLVYAFNKKDRDEQCVMFWDTKNNEKYLKYINRLLKLEASGEHCVLASKSETPKEYILILCNDIGSPVDSRYIEIPIQHLALTKNHVIVASDGFVYVWHFRPGLDTITINGKAKEGREKIFHIDQLPSAMGPDDWRIHMGDNSNPICSICANEEYLFVARTSGSIIRYALPHLSLEGKHSLRCTPSRMSINCDCSKLAIIDTNGVFSFMDFMAAGDSNIDLGVSGQHEEYERKDVWDMKWSKDSPNHIAILEKSRLYILRGTDPEEPVQSTAHLCEFQDLEVRSVHLDEVMVDRETPTLDKFVTFEARSLRDTRNLLQSTTLSDVYEFVDKNPHPKMWRILAEHALGIQDFSMADKAFVRCGEYHGIQFVQNLKRLSNPGLQKAEIAFYFQKFDEAETQYLKLGRPDLAIDMRAKLGDWFRVEKLISQHGSDDTTLAIAWNHIGDYYSDRHNWPKAVQYYAQAKNSEKLVGCMYALEDFEGLEKLAKVLPEGSPCLKEIGDQFQSIGLCEEGVAAFMKAGDPKRAIDCCVLLNHWNHAVDLAEKENFSQIEQLMGRYASKLMEKGRIVEAVELFRKGNRNMEAANLLLDLAKDLVESKVPPLHIKKLYVLAALEVERFRKRVLEKPEGLTALVTGAPTAVTAAQPTAAQTLAGLMTLDAASAQSNTQAFDNAWHSAEAYHFWMLGQQQFYAGKPEAAMRTALHLRQYEDVISPEKIYALLAIAAHSCKFYGQCSKAFVKLESLPEIPEEKRQQYSDIAMPIFLNNPPVDPRQLRESKSSKHPTHSVLEDLKHSKEDVCVASGRIIRDSQSIRCKSCKHLMIAAEVLGRDACPLCHAVLPSGGGGGADWDGFRMRNPTPGKWDLGAIDE